MPSVTDVAEAAEVSRATAYRYFPTQAALVQAAVDEALGPILRWRSDRSDAGERVADLLAFAYPRIDEYEATLRRRCCRRWTVEPAAGRHARRRGADLRGHRIELLRARWRRSSRRGAAEFDRLRQALSLIFGTEAFVVLKDIWGLDGGQTAV